jgi:AcrR family transcriptional regulator
MINNKKQTTIEKINNAARTLIFLYGIKGWSMDDFAKEAGLTKRTLYMYIDSKEELVEKVLLEYVQNIQTDLMNQLAKIPGFLKGLETILHIYPAMIMKLNSRVIQDIFKQYPAIEEHLIEKRLNLTSDIKEYISNGQRQGFVKQEVDVGTVIEIMQSLIIYYSKCNLENFGEKIKESFKTVIYGIIPEGVQ